MADENNNENAGNEAAQPAAPAKKGMPIGLIIGIVVVVLALGGGGFFMLNSLNSAEAAEGEEGTEEEVEITETNIFYEGFEMSIVNLAISDEYEYMYLKYGITVEVSNELVVSEIMTKQPRITSKVDSNMANQDWNEIATLSGRERLARELTRVINEELQEGEVINTFFSTFVAQ